MSRRGLLHGGQRSPWSHHRVPSPAESVVDICRHPFVRRARTVGYRRFLCEPPVPGQRAQSVSGARGYRSTRS